MSTALVPRRRLCAEPVRRRHGECRRGAARHAVMADREPQELFGELSTRMARLAPGRGRTGSSPTPSSSHRRSRRCRLWHRRPTPRSAAWCRVRLRERSRAHTDRPMFLRITSLVAAQPAGEGPACPRIAPPEPEHGRGHDRVHAARAIGHRPRAVRRARAARGHAGTGRVRGRSAERPLGGPGLRGGARRRAFTSCG